MLFEALPLEKTSDSGDLERAHLRRLRGALFTLCASLLTGCSEWQSALAPAGPYAGEIAALFWVFLGVCTLIWILVVVALIVGAFRRREPIPDPLQVDARREHQAGRVILACVSATVIVLLAFTFLSFFAQRNLWAEQREALTIGVTGHQWWWEVEYQDPDPTQTLTTANEIHIPVDQPIIVQLDTGDVIHSFWVPSLAGKMDLISGHTNETRLIASRPGVYRGQCAEFCGLQHANMAFLVVASPPDEFALWREQQSKPAPEPSNPASERGRKIFISRNCMLCHTVRGTAANGKVGPDLTHVASRRTLAAGTTPLAPGYLGGWLSDPQHVKPGNKMPWPELRADEVAPLVTYLMSLR